MSAEQAAEVGGVDPAAAPPASHWTSWPPMDEGPALTDEEQMALVTAVRVQQVARIIARDTGADEAASTEAAWSLASAGLLATPWQGERTEPCDEFGRHPLGGHEAAERAAEERGADDQSLAKGGG